MENDSSLGKNFPTQNINRKPKPYRSNSLTVEEQEKLLSVTESFEDLCLFRLALSTGIRREDICGIEVGNIDLDNRQLKFWESKKRRWWTVPLTVECCQEIKRFLNTFPNGRKKLFDMTGRTAYNRLQRYLAKAKINKELSFHDLRRTFIKSAKKKGLSPKAVSQITGDTLATIEQSYANLDMEELKEEVDKL
jgi:integrase/recombinase XerC